MEPSNARSRKLDNGSDINYQSTLSSFHALRDMVTQDCVCLCEAGFHHIYVVTFNYSNLISDDFYSHERIRSWRSEFSQKQNCTVNKCLECVWQGKINHLLVKLLDIFDTATLKHSRNFLKFVSEMNLIYILYFMTQKTFTLYQIQYYMSEISVVTKEILKIPPVTFDN